MYWLHCVKDNEDTNAMEEQFFAKITRTGQYWLQCVAKGEKFPLREPRRGLAGSFMLFYRQTDGQDLERSINHVGI
jgi:hypothetical protein